MNEGYPLVASAYAIKAQNICTELKDVRKDVKITLLKAAKRVDRQEMTMSFSIDINIDPNVEMSLDSEELQEAIIEGMPSSSRFVSIVPSSKLQPEQKFMKILLEVKALSTKTNNSSYNKVIRYISYVAHDPNPDYLSLQSKLASAQQRFTAAANRQAAANSQYNSVANSRPTSSGGLNMLMALSAIGSKVSENNASSDMENANREVAALANQMNNTSPTVPRNVYENYPYTVHKYHRTGSLEAVVKMLDENDRPVREKAIVKNYNELDSTHDGYSAAGLKNDPLDLLSEQKIKERFLKDLLSDSADISRSFFDEYWQKKMKSAKSEKNILERWNRGIMYALCVPSFQDDIFKEVGLDIKNLPDDFMSKMDVIFINDN